jgi:type 1 fimbria pilin
MMRATSLILVLTLLLLVPLGAAAKCKFTEGGNTLITFNPPSNITLSSSTPDGVIWTSSLITPTPAPVINCGFAIMTFGIVNARGGYVDNQTFETGVPNLYYSITHPVEYLVQQDSEYFTRSTFNIASSLVLIKHGPITSGSVLSGGNLADWKWVSDSFSGPAVTLIPETFVLGNSITFTTPSCTIVTDPINVILPTVTTSAFTNVGSTSGKTQFNIKLDCPTGTAVTKITMHTSAPDSSHSGVILPSGPGYAVGIGVRVLDSNSNPMVFETPTVVTPPNATTSIPYFAQYFQTAPTVTGGTVKATVTFDIFYQ